MTAAVVFDLDGTLIDSAPDLHGIANTLLAAEGRAPISLAEALPPSTRQITGTSTSGFASEAQDRKAVRTPAAGKPLIRASLSDEISKATEACSLIESRVAQSMKRKIPTIGSGSPECQT